MRKIQLAVMVLIVVLLGFAAGIKAEFRMGFSANTAGENGFYLSIGQYNNVPEQEVYVVRQQGIPDDELAVVFFVASKAGVPYGQVVKLRKQGWNWMKIAKKYRLDASVFYMPINGHANGRVYGKPYGYFLVTPRNKWNKINLSDAEVSNFVNLRFVSEHYGYAPEQVIKMREEGRDFSAINNEVKAIKSKNGKSSKMKKGKGNK